MASKGHGGLGKGLGALLKNREITPAKDQVQEIAASEIQAAILKTVEESDGLKNLAVVGFTSYCRSYATYSKELKTAPAWEGLRAHRR